MTVADVAAWAGMSSAEAARHAGLERLVLDAYLASAKELQDTLFRSLEAGMPWRRGTRAGLEAVFASVAGDRDRAEFCFVEIPRAGHALRLVREEMRRRSLARWKAAAALTGGPLDEHVHFDLLHGAVLYEVARCVDEGRMGELPAVAEALSRLAAA